MKHLIALCLVAGLGVLACGGAAQEATGVANRGADQPSSVPPAEWPSLLPNARLADEGLITGGQPDAEQLQAIRAAGFRTVVNLRAEGEPGARSEEVEALGLDYVALPVAGEAGLDEETAREFARILDTVERPAVIHCGSGNRVGALFALAAFYVDGAAPEEALAIGDERGLTRLRDAVRRHLEGAAAPAPD